MIDYVILWRTLAKPSHARRPKFGKALILVKNITYYMSMTIDLHGIKYTSSSPQLMQQPPVLLDEINELWYFRKYWLSLPPEDKLIKHLMANQETRVPLKIQNAIKILDEYKYAGHTWYRQPERLYPFVW